MGKQPEQKIRSVIMRGGRVPGDSAQYYDECCCARCGSSCGSDGCDTCGNDGFITDDDTEWGESEEFLRCPECLGNPVRYFCLSSAEWCEANPLPGRESTPRGLVEWFREETKGGE